MAAIVGFEGDEIVFRMEDGSLRSISKQLCDFVPQVGMEVEIRQEDGRYTLIPRSLQEKGGTQTTQEMPQSIGGMKCMAKERIRGNILKLLPVTLLGCLFFAVVPKELIVFVSLFLAPCIELGAIHIYLAILHQEPWSLDFLGKGFKPYWRCVGLAFLRSLYSFLWSLLFVIPGIIKWISYSQAMYLLSEHPHLEPNEALAESAKMMEGHKWKYFVMQLSFFGWILLSCLTCGILLVYVIPYMQETTAVFYRSLRKEA